MNCLITERAKPAEACEPASTAVNTECIFPSSPEDNLREFHGIGSIPVLFSTNVNTHLPILASANGVEQYSVFLAAWAVLLRYYVGQSDVGFGFVSNSKVQLSNTTKAQDQQRSSAKVKITLNKDTSIRDLARKLSSFELHDLMNFTCNTEVQYQVNPIKTEDLVPFSSKVKHSPTS